MGLPEDEVRTRVDDSAKIVFTYQKAGGAVWFDGVSLVR